MKVYLASDHAGFKLKEKIKVYLKGNGFEAEDLGDYSFVPDDDYPDFISNAAEKVSEDPENSRAIIFGGSGQAEAMLANKFPHVRCALFYSAAAPVEAADITGRESDDPFEMIRLTREHNNANILSLGARFLTETDAKKAVKAWLDQAFTKAPRHVRRLKKVEDIVNGRNNSGNFE